MYAEVMGGSTASAPAAAPAMTPMSERRRRPARVTHHSESKKLLKNLKRLNTFAEREARRLAAASSASKRRDAEKFCEELVKDGKATPAQVKAAYLPVLLFCDNTHQVHTFSDGGKTRRLTQFELKKQELAKLPRVLHFGERFAVAGELTGQSDGEAEKTRVRRFAEANASALKAGGYKTPNDFVNKFSELQTKKPGLTAREFLGPTAVLD